jgi:predicted HTH domain antitoxin
MDVVERGHTSLKKAAKYWNIPLNSFLDHMNGRIRCRKLGP